VRALTLRPGTPGSLTVQDIAEPAEDEGSVLVDGLAVGLCGTDVEIIHGDYGAPPAGSDHLVLGHENLGRVAQAPPDSGLTPGDLVVGVVRRPDPVPCPACAVGEWDMCRNGRYTEHGIVGRHGFARQRWREQPDALVRLEPAMADIGVLLEPATVVAKAWEQVYRIGSRAFWQPRTVAVTGAGPVGLLAALLAVQRGLAVHVFDIVTGGPKPALVAGLGATYHHETLPDSGLAPDVVIECTGVPSVIVDAMARSSVDGIVCLAGVSSGRGVVPVDMGGLGREAVMQNDVIFGTVNANRRHYDAAVAALAAADRSWLTALITRRVPLESYRDAFDRRPDDVKVVLDL
jgi:threonine dehydrogenase-like Zn-dependent dehydrogenase